MMRKREAARATGPCAVYISGNIGDSVLHLGFMRALSEELGRKLILINPLAPAVNRLFECQPYIERVISIRDIERDPQRKNRRRRMQELLDTLRLDTLFFFNFKTYVVMAALRSGIRRRIGFVRRHKFYNKLLFTHSVLVQKGGIQHPDTHTWLPRLFRAHGLPDQARYPSLLDGATATARAAELARGHTHLIALGLGASVAARRYPAARCAELIAQLRARDPRYSFLLFGADDVRELAAQIRALAGDAPLLDITGMDLDLCVSSALMARCLGCISNDSLALHVAVAHRVPSVGLFGISPPMNYVPWLRPIRADGPGGMDGISSNRVVQALLEQMAAFPRPA